MIRAASVLRQYGEAEVPAAGSLIHRTVPGEPVHALLRDLDVHWARQAPLSTFSPRQPFITAARGLRDAGWPVHDGPARWRLGELTVAWSAVAPLP